MRYDVYLRKTYELAQQLHGTMESLAGGFYGALIPNGDNYLMFALDLDDYSGWWVWEQCSDGERVCEDTIELGWIKNDQLFPTALIEIANHVCSNSQP